MKRIFLTLIIFPLVLAGTNVFAAGTCTQSLDVNFVESSRVSKVITFTCTADAANGSYPSTPISTANLAAIHSYFLYYLKTNPGTTAPTDNWDFAITDEDGIDVLGGAGANMHTTTSKELAPFLGSSMFAKPVIGAWTLAITGNSVNSAIIVIKAVFVK